MQRMFDNGSDSLRDFRYALKSLLKTALNLSIREFDLSEDPLPILNLAISSNSDAIIFLSKCGFKLRTSSSKGPIFFTKTVFSKFTSNYAVSLSSHSLNSKVKHSLSIIASNCLNSSRSTTRYKL